MAFRTVAEEADAVAAEIASACRGRGARRGLRRARADQRGRGGGAAQPRPPGRPLADGIRQPTCGVARGPRAAGLPARGGGPGSVHGPVRRGDGCPVSAGWRGPDRASWAWRRGATGRCGARSSGAAGAARSAACQRRHPGHPWAVDGRCARGRRVIARGTRGQRAVRPSASERAIRTLGRRCRAGRRRAVAASGAAVRDHRGTCRIAR